MEPTDAKLHVQTREIKGCAERTDESARSWIGKGSWAHKDGLEVAMHLCWSCGCSNKAYAKLLFTLEEMKDTAEFKSAFAEKIISDISFLRRNLRDVIVAIETDFINELQARTEAINKLRGDLITLMEQAFEVDFKNQE